MPTLCDCVEMQRRNAYALNVKCIETDIQKLTASRLVKELQNFPDAVIVPCKGGLASFGGRQDVLGLQKQRGLLTFMGNTFVEFRLKEGDGLVLVNAPDSAEDGQRHVIFMPVDRGERGIDKLFRVGENVLQHAQNIDF